MATNYWIGAAALQRNTLLFTCSAPTLGASKSISFNGRTITVLAADTTAATLASQFVSAVNSATDARVRDATATLDGNTFTLTGPADGAPLTSPAGSTGVTLTTNTAGTGPYHADNVDNYSAGALPSNGDTLVFDRGGANTGPRYALTALTSITLAVLRVMPGFRGNIGLPNNRGNYLEFRPKYLETAAAAYEIYSDQPDGDQRLKLFAKSASATTWTIQGVGTNGANGLPLEIQGVISTSALVATNYGVAIASESGSTAVLDTTLATLNSSVLFGAGATVSVQHTQTGGSLVCVGGLNLTSLENVNALVQGAGTTGSHVQDGGRTNWQSTGGLNSLTLRNQAVMDFSNSPSIASLPGDANATEGCTIIDGLRIDRPYSITAVGCRYQDLNIITNRNVKVSVENP